MHSLYTAIISCFLNLIVTPIVIWIAHRNKWFDPVNERKIHTGSIPRLGGIGIFWTSYVAITAFTLLSIVAPSAKAEWDYLPVIIGMLIVHLLSLVDDFRGLSARFRFIVQVIVALVMCYFNICFHSLWLPFVGAVELPTWLSWSITVLWIVGVINAMNFIDGMDGLCGGICIIASCTYGIIFLLRGESLPALYAFALVGSLAGFLFYNFPPAKIFMGDSGSTYLGFMMAILPLLTRRPADYDLELYIGATVIIVPIFDTFTAMVRRLKAGKPIMSPDKRHVHHKLLGMGLGRRAILSVIYTVTMGLGAVALISIYFDRMVFFILTMITWLVILGLFIALHFLKESGFRFKNEQD